MMKSYLWVVACSCGLKTCLDGELLSREDAIRKFSGNGWVQYQSRWYCPDCAKSPSFHEMRRADLAHVTIERLATAMREAIRQIYEEPVTLGDIAQLLREALYPWEAVPKEG